MSLQTTKQYQLETFSNDQRPENRLLELWAYCSPENKFLATVLATAGNTECWQIRQTSRFERPCHRGYLQNRGNAPVIDLFCSNFWSFSTWFWWQDCPVLPPDSYHRGSLESNINNWWIESSFPVLACNDHCDNPHLHSGACLKGTELSLASRFAPQFQNLPHQIERKQLQFKRTTN